MKIVESVCGNCGAKDTLFPVPWSDSPQAWRCEECGKIFREETASSGDGEGEPEDS